MINKLYKGVCNVSVQILRFEETQIFLKNLAERLSHQ